jgi:thiol:disulfide interchange protein DsbD
LGSAIGFAFASPLWAVVVIFLSAALGLALPFLVLAAFPQWVKFLPKPGLWMEKLKISLGFAMIAVTLWLVWVYSFGRSDSVFPMLSYLLILGLLAWIFGQRLTARKKSGRLLMSFIPLVLSVGFALLLVPEFKSFISGESRIGEESASAEDLPEPWIKFEESKIDQALKEGRFVFVDFTARWCLTCRVNEAGVLSSSEFLDNAKKENVLLLRGDYTNTDPLIDEWLKKYRRAGVPFYLLLRPGRTPVLFGELLGPAFIKDFAGALMP